MVCLDFGFYYNKVDKTLKIWYNRNSYIQEVFLMTDRRVTILFTQEQYEKMNDALSQTIYKNLSQYIRETMEMISDLIISSDEMEVLLVTNERDNGSV
jgi:hypothetical protein